MPSPAIVLAFAQLAAASSLVHDGRQGQVAVRPPRVAAEATIDGILDEAVWSRAAVLTGFSRYAPTDDGPADDSTKILIWYSPTAIHFGVRAYAEPGTVQATLADRDRMFSDDYVGIFLSTFNDGRQATVFGANPLGIQGDGIVVESGRTAGGGFGSGSQSGREPTDISPDYVYQSKGRLTPFGFEIEIRVPFKSLKYQSAASQTWGINVLRRVQSRSREYTWTPAKRSAASFLGQGGRLIDLSELRRGVVLDLNPFVSTRVNGARVAPTDYAYDRAPERIGANVRWGVTNNLTFNGTLKPDFAEVESDASQTQTDPRRALFFPEKRPFFLDGIEQFGVPSQLIYTRRIGSPIVAAKLAGKANGINLALLSAVDERTTSDGNRHPLFNIVRLQRDIGAGSRVGIVYTDRYEARDSARLSGSGTNRVIGADGRFVWRRLYSAQVQAAASHTESPDGTVLRGPLYLVDLRRSGRTLNARYAFDANAPDFQALSGFISRPGVAHANVRHTYTHYPPSSSALRSAALELALDGLWQYDRFVRRGDMIEKKLHINNNYELRGGWRLGASLLLESFGYDPSFYGSLAVARPRPGGGADTIPFTGTPRIPNRDYVVSLTTPNLRRVSANVLYVWGRDENFFEWAPSDIRYLAGSADWRPTDQLRVGVGYLWQYYERPGDGSVVGETRIPRLKLEYQLRRAMFVRVVGEYRSDFADDLRDDSRTGDPVLRRTARGFVRARGFSTVEARAKQVNELRPDVLFSYAPSPGTVLYAGYGSLLNEPEAFRFARELTRSRDSFFIKASRLFRM